MYIEIQLLDLLSLVLRDLYNRCTTTTCQSLKCHYMSHVACNILVHASILTFSDTKILITSDQNNHHTMSTYICLQLGQILLSLQIFIDCPNICSRLCLFPLMIFNFLKIIQHKYIQHNHHEHTIHRGPIMDDALFMLCCAIKLRAIL